MSGIRRTEFRQDGKVNPRIIPHPTMSQNGKLAAKIKPNLVLDSYTCCVTQKPLIRSTFPKVTRVRP
jgi:hypothetical protein